MSTVKKEKSDGTGRVLSIEEAAKWLGISVRYLRYSDAPRYRLGRRVLFKSEEIEKWLNTKRA